MQLHWTHNTGQVHRHYNDMVKIKHRRLVKVEWKLLSFSYGTELVLVIGNIYIDNDFGWYQRVIQSKKLRDH